MSCFTSLSSRLRGWPRPLAVWLAALAGAIRAKRAEPKARAILSSRNALSAPFPAGVSDFEDLKDLQWEIHENEARYRDLLDSQADLILRRDARGCLTFVNSAFCRAFGVEHDAVLGKVFHPRILSDDPVVALLPGTGLQRQRYIQRVETVAGGRWLVWDEHVVGRGSAPACEVQCVGRDITEARRIKKELEDARAQAEAANRAKSRFLAAMSHEIRTPMNGILGMTALLCETQLSSEQQTYAHAVDRSARTLLTLIDEILDFSKIEADKLELNEAPLAIDDCVQGVVELLAPKAYEKGIDIAWAADPSLPHRLLGDEVRLRQIIINLVGNAIRFTDVGGVLVTVGPAPVASPALADQMVEVAVVVEDTGIGLAEDALPVLFSEFEQGQAAVRRHQGGTGLGLTISRRLARAMGGDIRCTSAPGRGATFTAIVRLRNVSDTAAASPPNRPCHVLLAMDEPIQGRALRLSLEGAGIPVKSSSLLLAEDLIEVAGSAREPFSAVIVSARGGCEAAGRVLAHARGAAPCTSVLGVVVVDAPSKADFPAFRQVGFNAYLVRPVRPQSLLTHLRLRTADPSEQAMSSEPLSSMSPRPHEPVRRILLVEDNEINTLLARRLLEKIGCDVRVGRNGREAVDAMQRVLAGIEQAYDLVLMDVHMPVLDGLEATGLINGLYAEHALAPPPIVAVTANAFDEDRRLCLDAGMSDYLAKPFEREDLERLLERWCGAPQGTRAA